MFSVISFNINFSTYIYALMHTYLTTKSHISFHPISTSSAFLPNISFLPWITWASLLTRVSNGSFLSLLRQEGAILNSQVQFSTPRPFPILCAYVPLFLTKIDIVFGDGLPNCRWMCPSENYV